ncbi:SDR family NAD(P)-dependent oxidoreductase [Nocardia carnea]|uniref:SDR family NAD(P)-dependent oxidoreductase n=1 Tax=Nocardia carnea TaxID=37328 RepID=A0ABW7TMY7_9NOCA|nr:SDR family NAD(P)-dependent oxidoreductase [Nocardia carnea]
MTVAARRFESGTAVVTGGGSGLGEGFARRLATLGMSVVVADIDLARAEKVAAAVVSAGGRAEARLVDVTDADEVDAMASNVFARYGSVELLVNNAGVEEGGLSWEMSPARWKKVTGVNFDGIFHCVRSFVPRMIESGVPACIANVSSVGAFNSMPAQAAYIATKHAVLAFTECLHQEIALVEAPIQVSAVVPNWIRSRIFVDAAHETLTGNPAADALFGSMKRSVAERGMEPLAAAEHIVEAIARGDFWVFSDDEACTRFAEARAHRLSTLSAPDAPGKILERLGVEPMSSS